MICCRTYHSSFDCWNQCRICAVQQITVRSGSLISFWKKNAFQSTPGTPDSVNIPTHRVSLWELLLHYTPLENSPSAPWSFKSYIAISDSAPEKLQKNKKSSSSMLEITHGRRIASTYNFLKVSVRRLLHGYIVANTKRDNLPIGRFIECQVKGSNV